MIATTIDENIERIRLDLASRGLTYDRLMDDLLDHVCCMVEEDMQAGSDFESSYGRILESIGDNQLQAIQHQTLINLDKKFQRMKNFTYVFGLSAAVLTIIGSIFKSLHWAGSGILLAVGVLLIVLGFLPLYFLTSFREQPELKNPVYPIVGYVTLAMLLLGSLFKIMHWPGAGIIILVGAGLLIIGFVPLYVVNAFQKGGKARVNLPYIIMLLVGVALVMLFSNIRMSRYLIDVYLEESITNETRIKSINERTAHLLEMANDSAFADKVQSVEKIHDHARALQVLIDEMQKGMLVYLDQAGVPIDKVKGKDNIWAGREAIVKQDRGRFFSLESIKFRKLLFELVKDPVTQGQIEDHLEFTGSVYPHEYSIKDVGNDPLMKNYYKLTDASKGIALSEYVAISYLLHH
jgi:hypothetical protein